MSSESDASSKADQTRTQDALSAAKQKWETRKLPLEVILLGLAIAYAVAFSLGAILIFLYFFHYDFNPGGISASDTVLMSLTFFAVALFMAFFLTLGAYAVYPICALADWLWEKIRDVRMKRVPRLSDGGIDTARLGKMVGHHVQFDWKLSENVWNLLPGCMALALAVSIACLAPVKMYTPILSVLVGGFFISVGCLGRISRVYSEFPRKDRPELVVDRLPSWAVYPAICIGVIVPIFAIGFAQLPDIALMKVGFRKQNVSVQLAKADFERLVDKATRYGIAINPCETLKDNAYVLNRVDVLWNKLGTKGLLQFPTQDVWADDSASAQFRIEPLNSDINVVEVDGPKLQCEEFLTDVLFQSSNAALSVKAENRLERDLSWMGRSASERVVRVAVHGADASLNLQHAFAIKNYLIRKFHLAPASVSVVNFGVTEPKQSCANQEGTALKLCERMNRRIEILRYAPGDLISPL